MSLINDQQKKNAGTKEPTIKPVKASPLPVLEPDTSIPEVEAAPPVQEEAAFSAESQSLLSSEASAPLPPPVEPQGEQQPSLEVPSVDLLPIAPVEIQRAPEKPILETPSIWRDTSEEFGLGASLKPEVANTMLPSFSVDIPDNSGSINKAFFSNSTAIGNFNSKARDEFAAAQKAQAQTQARGALPNTPDATKRWYSAPLGFLSDVLFGSEEAKKKSEAGTPDLGAGSFGRAGAGVGGALNYTLGVIPSLFVGAVGEANKAAANTLQSLGVKKETAEGFVRNGFLQFLPDSLASIKPSSVLNFNFGEANKRNLVIDAVAGDPLTDVNDPDGSVKYGRIYTRTQRKEGSSPTSDPVGFALQIGTYLFNPGEIPGDAAISYGVGKLFSAFKKPAAASLENIGKVKQQQLALPPTSTLRQEQELSQRAAQIRANQAFAQNTSPKPNPNPGFDLGDLTEEQLRRLNTGTPRLGGTSEVERLSLPSSGQLAPAQANIRALNTTQEGISELNPPRLDGGEARLEGGAIEFTAPSELNPPRLDFGEATIEYPTDSSLPAGANPTNVPRAYLGTTEVTRGSLPPAFSPSEAPRKEGSYRLPYSTPGKTAVELGIGQPGFRIESPGALALRPLEQVISELEQIEPKLLEGFDGLTWEEFKLHMSEKLEDIGQVSAIGEDLKAFNLQEGALKQERANPPVEYDELAAIVQELAFQKKYTQAQMLNNLEQLNSEALEKYNSGFRINLTESTIVKQSTDEEVLSSVDLTVVKKRIREKGLTLRGDETASELSVIADEAFKIKNTPRFKEILQAQIDNRAIAIYEKIEDIPKLSKKDLLEKLGNVSIDISPKIPSSFVNTTDDLLTAAEELAQHKLALDKPLKQLDSLFEETVDFGRKTPESTGFDFITKEEAFVITENGGVLKLAPNIFVDSSKVGKRLREAWLSGDYETIVEESKKLGISFDDALASVVERNNSYIEAANKVRNVLPPAEALTSVEGSLFHGTALDGWQPPANLYVNGSRGELGGGTYYTLDKDMAVDYAKARVGENVNPKTFDTDLNPSVAEVRPSFIASLDARKPLPKDSLKQVFADLPPEVNKKFVASVNRKKKPVSYVKLRELMEEAFVKAGVEPTEEILQQADADIGKNLRAMGFDSVVDKESGFVLSLDNSRVGLVNLENVPKPTAIEASTARFNVDSAAAKAYEGFLTADANLRDSTYKVLEQVRAATDKVLTEVQDEIIKRGLPEQPTILPKLDSQSSRPKSFVEAIDELLPDDICSI